MAYFHSSWFGWCCCFQMKSVQALVLALMLVGDTVLGQMYVNQFAVHVPRGRRSANAIADSHGFTNHGQIGSLENHFLFEHPHVHRRSAELSHHHHRRLSEHPHVEWVEQQKILSRKKRDFLPVDVESNDFASDISNQNTYGQSLNRNRRHLQKRDESSRPTMHFNDEWYNKMWYFLEGGVNHTDMNVIGAWKKGYTGKGVVVTILDDGIERNHTDLIDNYDPYASTDVNGHDPDPIPRYDPSNENRHGTRCAGEVSAKANNSKCIVGAAYESSIGGVRMLDGDVFDAVEATSLSFNRSHIDIYSASWGPDDDGRVVDGPGVLAKKAFIDGIRLGRQEKGSIFVWASGNGGNNRDSCNCDGYTNSIYTLSVSSISMHGKKPWYLEECASTLTTTYSSGHHDEAQIITVDLRNKCTQTHTGTSASAPLAAGLIALALHANPSLTWRDVQYISLMTARPLLDGAWVTNGVGRKVSLRYGYGLMDATAMVELAEKWTNVPEQHICRVQPTTQNMEIPNNGYEEVLDTTACAGTGDTVNFLEHVLVNFTITSRQRGSLQIYITSPMGTRSTILPQRPNDRDHTKGFTGWSFLSVHFWGENPVGRWKLEIEITGSQPSYMGGRYQAPAHMTNKLVSWSLILHGTEPNPVNLTPVPSQGTPTVHPTPSSGPCHAQCAGGCTGPAPTQCNACANYKMQDSGMCVASCPPAFYGQDSVCNPCSPACETCTTVSAHSVMCLTCKPGFLLIEGKGTCETFCETGYYQDGGRCRVCSGKCAACSGSEDQCTACRWGLQLVNTVCVPEKEHCPSGQYLSEGGCVVCPDGCFSCHNSSDCTCCSKGSYLQEGSCVNMCDSGYLPFHVNYSSNLVFQQCQQCDADACSVCPDGFRFANGVCVQMSNCPEGTYFQWNSMSCKACYTSCRSCIGPGTSDCLSCYSPYGYNNLQRKCQPCCTDGEDKGSRGCCHCIDGKCDESATQGIMSKLLGSTTMVFLSLAGVCIAVILVFGLAFLVVHLRKRKMIHSGIAYEKLLQNEHLLDIDGLCDESLDNGEAIH